jgi:hypothetical protein
MFDAVGGGGGLDTIKVLLIGVDSVQCNTRQRRNDKQILIVGVNSNRTQSGRLQKDKVEIRDFNSR